MFRTPNTPLIRSVTTFSVIIRCWFGSFSLFKNKKKLKKRVENGKEKRTNGELGQIRVKKSSMNGNGRITEHKYKYNSRDRGNKREQEEQ